MRYLLTAAGFTCWAYVYIEMIRVGNREKMCAMPFFALAFNIAWEALYTVEAICHLHAEAFLYLPLLVLDIFILLAHLKYGKCHFPSKAQHLFLFLSGASLAAGIALMLAFYFQFDVRPASHYSSFLRYAFMSLLFVYAFYTRNDIRGQSLGIAIVKCIGTLLLAVQYGYIEMINPFVLICAAVSFSADIWYIIALAISKKGEAA